jgi:hypothetical protein
MAIKVVKGGKEAIRVVTLPPSSAHTQQGIQAKGGNKVEVVCLGVYVSK